MTRYRNVTVSGLDIFYREAGNSQNPTILLLHGFPTSSHMFRNLMPKLEKKFHLVAPDYPGFGQSSMPAMEDFEYSFANLAEILDRFTVAIGLDKYSLYLMDYGAPVGFRLACKHPGRVQALLIQNGNAYEEGLMEFWKPVRAFWADPTNEEVIATMRGLLTPEGTKWQYTQGVQDLEKISPDTWTHDQALLDRPNNKEIQVQLMLSYETNIAEYATWQEYFRKFQPPALITWGANDPIFPAEGAYPYKRDLKNVEFHLLNTGHFALEDHYEEIAALVDDFLTRNRASVLPVNG